MRDTKDLLHVLDEMPEPDIWAEVSFAPGGRDHRVDLDPRRARPEPSSRRRAVIALAALAMVAVPFSGLWLAFRSESTSKTNGPAETSGEIVYSATVDARWELFTVRPDGTNVTKIPIAGLPDNAIHPSWSPDGTRIAFDAHSGGGSGSEGGDRDIYVVNADGSALERLTSTGGWDYLPSWSPDGSRIAFVRNTDGNDDIWIMDSNGDHPRRLTDDSALDLSPTWSPDGTRLAFVSNRDGSPEIYAMDAEGTSLVRLTHDDAYEGSPEWSPDGTSVAFASDVEGPGLYVMDADGANVRKVAPSGQVGAVEGAWSVDGSAIAFVSAQGTDSPSILQTLDLATGSTITLRSGDELCCPDWSGQQGSPVPSIAEPSITRADVSDVIDVGPATAVAYGEGSVWVAAHPTDGVPAILRIDPGSDEIIATIPTSVVPTWEVGGGGLVVSGGSVWAAGSTGGSEGTIVRIDPATNRVVATLEIPDGPVGDVAVNSAGIWAMVNGSPGEPDVVRIDPSNGQTVATIPLTGGYGRSIFAGEGWVLASVTQPPHGAASGGALVHIDTATNETKGVFDLGTYPSVAEGDGVVWAVTSGGLVQIDPMTAGPIGNEAQTGCTGDALAVGAGGVWCFDPSRDRALMRFNPATGGVDIDGTRSGSGVGDGGLALVTSPGSVWVIDGADLVRVDLLVGSSSSVPIGFAYAPSWDVVTTTPDVSALDAPPDSPTTWAANVPFASEDLAHVESDGYLHASYGPWTTIAALPPNGVVILTGYLPQASAPSASANFPARDLPFLLADADVQPNWEGQINPDVPQYAIRGFANGQLVEVRVFFGSLHPPADVLAEAQDELDRMHVPEWTPGS